MSVALSFILILGFIIIYVFLVQIYSVLFRVTGLTKEKATFQTISLLTNSGFTTNESEVIVSSKTRRKIAVASMISGYAFSVVIVSLTINILIKLGATIGTDGVEKTFYTMLIAFGIFIVLILLSQIPPIKKGLESLIQKIAVGLIKKTKNKNVVTLIDNLGKNAIAEVYINVVPEALESLSLEESKIKDNYNINVLMGKRKSRILDISRDTVFQKGDLLVVFGPYQSIKDLFEKNGKKEIEERESQDNLIDLIDTYGRDTMASVTLNRIPSFMRDKSISECGLKQIYGINILFARRNSEMIKINSNTILNEGDVITVFGSYRSIRDAFTMKDENV